MHRMNRIPMSFTSWGEINEVLPESLAIELVRTMKLQAVHLVRFKIAFLTVDIVPLRSDPIGW